MVKENPCYIPLVDALIIVVVKNFVIMIHGMEEIQTKNPQKDYSFRNARDQKLGVPYGKYQGEGNDESLTLKGNVHGSKKLYD